MGWGLMGRVEGHDSMLFDIVSGMHGLYSLKVKLLAMLAVKRS
jgi:hypothetical protein